VGDVVVGFFDKALLQQLVAVVVGALPRPVARARRDPAPGPAYILPRNDSNDMIRRTIRRSIHNQQLSEQRAESVAAYSEPQRIVSERLITEGSGERFPIARNDTPKSAKRTGASSCGSFRSRRS